ncbi:MAG TPA: hypothetical protein VK463_07145 [Desulfomonilaceae bacterium]|nr:hypothetical protein [Desulfomonilaceae bacterium]
MKDKKESPKSYVWVKDASGAEFLCPVSMLKDPRNAADEELKNCVDVAALKPYVDDI